MSVDALVKCESIVQNLKIFACDKNNLAPCLHV